MTPSSKHTAVKYHWFRQHVGKEFVILKIESENQKADIFTKGGLKTTPLSFVVFNPSKKLVVDCYADTDFAGLWGHEDPQDPICARSRTVFVVTFSNCPLLWVSKL